ncbi:MAG: tRNA 2-selenouridine synthase [Betaproteobacteria bacterium ADurb.Bin341]|nr:MAG: tRNA 2-selenouridine synthase [Betaproteobacteria bacterium ADurb.Bin341]
MTETAVRLNLVDVGQIGCFETIVDVRSPAEFAEDHLPGAQNYPVLDDAERAQVGALYRQVSPFAARKLGAALVARNIARHIEESFCGHDKNWKPLIYCWRGGQRSEAMTLILGQIGWKAAKLEGGYKAWRQRVVQMLEILSQQFDFRLIAGPTGSGKSRLLEALAAQGAQVLHLEQLAAHKGSVLGGLPDVAQPSQKMFESRLYSALSAFDPGKPVYTEAESRRIGAVALPNALHAALAQAPCLKIVAPLQARVDFLVEDYAWVSRAPELLRDRLLRLRDMHSRETLQSWLELAEAGSYAQLAAELLAQHYDPLYQRSQTRQFSQFANAPEFEVLRLDAVSLQKLAAAILAGNLER